MTPLTDEQFCQQLEEACHAAGNTHDAEVMRLCSVLTDYRTETLQWAERRSATHPSLAPAAQRRERWAALPRWSLATIAIVTIAAGVAHLSEQSSASGDQFTKATVTSVQEARSSAEEIAADNRLLNSIDAELSYHGRSPVDGFDLKHREAGAVRESSRTEPED